MLKELLAPLVRWPLQSPLRFYGSIVVLIVAFALVATMHQADRKQSDPIEDAAATATTTPATPSPSGGQAGTAPASDAAGDAQAAETAQKFVAAWGTPQKKEDWNKAVRPLVTDDLMAGLSATDPEKVDKYTPRGTPQQIPEDSTPNEPVYLVDTNRGGITVTLNRADDGTWKVNDVDQAGDAG